MLLFGFVLGFRWVVYLLVEIYVVRSHEMDSLWGPVRNSGGHIIT